MTASSFQQNTFTRGMDLDTDKSMLSHDAYREAENVRLVTNDSGTGFVLQNVEGVKKYNLSIPSDETVIGTSTIQDIGIVITKKSDGLNKVYRVTGFDSATPVQTVILKGYLGLCENLNTNPSLSIVSNYESNNNIKIYFTDGTSGIKVLNIVDDKYTEDSSLIDSDGNILNPLALDLTPGADLSPFQIVDLGTGSLPVGVVQYGYQLFNVHGSESVISPLSESVHLTTSITTQNSQDYKGAYKGENSGKSCEISTTYNSKDFDKCRIIRIQYEDNNDMPRIIIVDEITISSTYEEIHYIDSGNSYLGEMSIEEFNILSSYQFKGNTIEKMQNRLFVANVQEDTWDPGFYDARAYRCNLDGQVLLESSNKLNNITFTNIDTADFSTVPEDHDCINPSNYKEIGQVEQFLPDNTGKLWPNDYEYCKKTFNGVRVLGGNGINIDYIFITTPIYLTDEQHSPTVADNNCSMNVSPRQINSLEFTGSDNSVTTYLFDDQTIGYRQHNYADPFIAANFKGYQRDEIYRFGIIFYNEKSIPSPVYWIADIKIPHPTLMNTFTIGEDNRLQGNAIGVQFTIKTVPEGAIAYEIVRCDRTEQDRSIVMQGILTNLYEYQILDENIPGYDGCMTGTTDYMFGNPGISVDTRPFIYLEYQDKNTAGQNDNGSSSKSGGSAFTITWNRREDDDNGFEKSVQFSNLRVDDYVRFISPEVCIQQKNSENIINSDLRISSIGNLFTKIDRTGSQESGSIRVSAPATTVVQTGGEQKSIDGNHEYVKRLFNEDWSMDTWVIEHETAFGDSSDDNVYYPTSVFKYFYADYVTPSFNQEQVRITSSKYPETIPYNSIQNLTSYKINIGDRTYVNFAVSSSNGAQWINSPNWNDSKARQAYMGPAGPCMIIQASGIRNTIDSCIQDYDVDSADTPNRAYFSTAVKMVNLKRNNNSQYGGNTYASRQNSVYVSTNSYVKIKDIGSTSTFTYGGDIFLGLLDYPVMTTFQLDDENSNINQKKFETAYIPFETSINLNLLNGDMAHMTYNTATNYIDSHLQMEPTQRQTWHVQDTPYFVYNAVYSSQPGSRKFLPKSIYSESNMKMSNRILVSQAKTNNEILDNWTVFKAADFLDVDSQYGNITNLKKFKDRLFFFQDQAVGIAAVNERSLINDGNVGQLVLGTGGILTRYDYITTTNGTSIINDRSICESDNVLYWYDYDKNELCHYTGQVGQLSKEKQIQSYLNEMYDKKRNVVLSFYDKKYNEMWFKFYDKTIAFNEMIGRFTSFYTFNPDWSLVFSDKIVTLKDNDYYVINTLDTDGLGEVSKDANIKFIVNDNYFYTKVFDNILISGDLLDGNRATKANGIITKLLFDTKHQHSEISNPTFDYREDTFRLPIPREETDENDLTYSARMRGKLLECEYDFDANDGKTFRIPQIITTYRYSRV